MIKQTRKMYPEMFHAKARHHRMVYRKRRRTKKRKKRKKRKRTTRRRKRRKHGKRRKRGSGGLTKGAPRRRKRTRVRRRRFGKYRARRMAASPAAWDPNAAARLVQRFVQRPTWPVVRGNQPYALAAAARFGPRHYPSYFGTATGVNTSGLAVVRGSQQPAVDAQQPVFYAPGHMPQRRGGSRRTHRRRRRRRTKRGGCTAFCLSGGRRKKRTRKKYNTRKYRLLNRRAVW